jgi:hypothetical protein
VDELTQHLIDWIGAEVTAAGGGGAVFGLSGGIDSAVVAALAKKRLPAPHAGRHHAVPQRAAGRRGRCRWSRTTSASPSRPSTSAPATGRRRRPESTVALGRRRAERIIAERRARASSPPTTQGNSVCAVVSRARRHHRRAARAGHEITPDPPEREMDMLLSPASASAAPCWPWPSTAGLRGGELHRLAGRHRHRHVHTKAKILDIRRRPRRSEAWPTARSRSSPASRASRPPRTSPRSAAAAPTPPPSRWRTPSAPTSARSTPTSTASTRQPRSCQGPQARRHLLRRDARDGGLRRAGAGAALGRVRAQVQRPHPRALELHRRRGHLGERGR